MYKQRGSATMMAIAAMLILSVGVASVAYVSTGNINIMGNYADGLEAQYAAEAALKLVYVTGKAADNTNQLPLADKSSCDIRLPEVLGGLDATSIRVNRANPTDAKNKNYNIRAVAKYRNLNRVTYAYNMIFQDYSTTDVVERDTEVTAKELVGDNDVYKVLWNGDSSTTKTQKGLWTPESKNSSVMLSPGFGDDSAKGWMNTDSRILFGDSLGLSDFLATNRLQLVFRINYYITLTKIPSFEKGFGYGVYYLAPQYQPYNKEHTSSAGKLNAAGDPTAYVLQYDPGLNPAYAGNTAWGALSNTESWPYGAFLVKKVWWDGVQGPQNEVWDEGDLDSYSDTYAFQDNDELMQRYYRSQGTDFVLASDSFLPALQPESKKPASVPPMVTQAPTAFGLDAGGTFKPERTGPYRDRPPDLRLLYTLGDIAEGNPWQANTYYPLGAKVTVGAWMDDPLHQRMVWMAAVGGKSGASKPSQLGYLPVLGDKINDGGVVWEARKAPTPEEIANYICDNGISIAKISMADLKLRIDDVNGKFGSTDDYSIPFSMYQGNKNKITIELWTDNKNNRIHLIRVNDVLALAFNDSYVKGKYNILPKNWVPGGKQTFGTGLKLWHTAVKFYAKESYGQTLLTTSTSANLGEWRR